MRYLKPNSIYKDNFSTVDSVGELTNASGSLTGSIYHNGILDGGFSITISNQATGIYSISGTVPTGYAAGDICKPLVQCNVDGQNISAFLNDFIIVSGNVYDSLQGTGILQTNTVQFAGVSNARYLR